MSEKTHSERTRLLGLDDRTLGAECEIDLYRASGAGGQKRNKTSSAVRMRHTSTGIMASATESRGQADNRRVALERLRTNIALDLREPLVEGEGASLEVMSLLSRGPLGKTSKRRSDTHYLLLLAQVLDVLEAFDGALSQAAEFYGVSTASLGKFLRGDERVARRYAEMRTRHGLKPLR